MVKQSREPGTLREDATTGWACDMRMKTRCPVLVVQRACSLHHKRNFSVQPSREKAATKRGSESSRGICIRAG